MCKQVWNVIITPLEVFRREEIPGRLRASAGTALAAAGLGAVLLPVVYNLFHGKTLGSAQFVGMLIALITSVGSFFAVCGLFRLLSKAFGKEIGFIRIVSVWGLSYLPNLLCVLLYALTLFAPSLCLGNNGIAFLVSALFILCLVWKAIFYFLFVRFVLDASLGEFVTTTAVSAVVFAVLLMIGFRLGIQVPML